jgi:hypothetical protein
MAPAFSSVRHAAAFTLLLGALLLLPAMVARSGALDRADVYPTLPVNAGPFSYIQRQIFEETGDIDLAFIGSSFMWNAFDVHYVQRELSTALGRPVTVRTLASVWPGIDRDYALVRDLVSQRRVRMVVLKLPNRELPTDDPLVVFNRVTNTPHIQAFRFFRVGELAGMLDGLHARERASLYAGAVLGMPRHLLSLLRPNYLSLSPADSLFGGRIDHRGYFGAPYVEFRPAPPVIPAQEMIYSAGTASRFRFFHEPLPHYQTHFVRMIGRFLKERGVPLVLVHIPQANETRRATVEERLSWLEQFPELGAKLIGVPPSRLFQRFSDAEVKRFFSSDHLNQNGTVYFTHTITPALIQVFRDHEEAR